MRFASVAEVKDGLSRYLSRASRRGEAIVVTRHGKPWALISPISARDLEADEWEALTLRRLRKAWEGEPDALYDYL